MSAAAPAPPAAPAPHAADRVPPAGTPHRQEPRP
jgi:hypothetical protein